MVLRTSRRRVSGCGIHVAARRSRSLAPANNRGVASPPLSRHSGPVLGLGGIAIAIGAMVDAATVVGDEEAQNQNPKRRSY